MTATITTIWVTRDRGQIMEIRVAEPRHDGRVWFSDHTGFLDLTVPACLWSIFGLTEEPAPDSCWKVEWKDQVIHIREMVGQGAEASLQVVDHKTWRVPFATDVTQEVKRKPGWRH